MSESIIEDTGEIKPGAWGMKEIKICSCFLSGKDLLETNTNNPDYIKVVECPTNFWEDSIERFCYVITLEKPRYVLVVTNKSFKENIKKEWNKYGIKIVSPEEFKNTNIDYDFLYITSGTQIDEKIKKKFSRVIENGNYNFNGENINFQTSLDFIVKENYLKYLEKYLNKQQYLLSIYFEDDNVSHRWIDWWKNGRGKLFSNNKVECVFPCTGNCEIQNHLDWSSFNEYLGNNNQRRINILRHTGITPIQDFARLEENINNLYYQQHASYSDPFFSLLMNIDPFELGNLMICQILEATLLNVLVIDERVAQVLETAKSPDEPDVELEKKLYWMGIYVAKSVKINGQSFNYIEKQNTKMVEVDFSKILNSSDKNHYCIEDDIPIDILLIHATRLNEIYNEYKNKTKNLSKEEFVEEIKKKIPYVIVHSGRGKTKGDIPSNTPFLEYSIVQKYLIQEPSKFYLVQIALGTKGGE